MTQNSGQSSKGTRARSHTISSDPATLEALKIRTSRGFLRLILVRWTLNSWRITRRSYLCQIVTPVAFHKARLGIPPAALNSFAWVMIEKKGSLRVGFINLQQMNLEQVWIPARERAFLFIYLFVPTADSLRHLTGQTWIICCWKPWLGEACVVGRLARL